MAYPHLAKGSTKPEVNPDVLRIYSMRFCPYAERSRLAATFKNIPYEEVNVNLREKPEWLFDLNPTGLVPILEYKGHVIYESAIINEYLHEAFPGTESEALLPADPFQRAKIKLFQATIDAKVRHLFQIVTNTGEKREEALSEWFKDLPTFESYLSKTTGPFFGGAHVGMVDVHIWPFFERLPAFSTIAEVDLGPKPDSYPHLTTWIAAMENTKAVKKIHLNDNLHKRFLESMLAGSSNYDLE